MKLRAIRVAEVGRFKTPAALEGLSGGLDLLVGPNEAGKSTLLRAAELALREKHTSNKAEIRALKPYGGGAPLVEVEFDVGRERWRLRKRYLAEKNAELEALGSGRIARGGDVDAALDDLFGANAIASRLSLLWLAQGSLVTAPAAVPDGGRDLVHAAVTAEIANAAGGGAVRRMRREVAALLDAEVTKTGLRKNGRLAGAERELARAREAYEAAQQRAREDEAAVEQLGRLESEAAALRDAGAESQRQQRLEAAEAVLKTARKNASLRDTAAVAEAKARRRHELAAGALKALTDTLQAIARQNAEVEAQAQAIQKLEGELAAAQLSHTAALEADRALTSKLEAVQDDIARARAREASLALVKACQQAEAAAGRIQAIDGELKHLPASDQIVGEVRRLASAIEAGQARLEAQSATVTVAYEPGAEGRITRDGVRIADGARMVAQARLDLTVAGVGRITVTPSEAGDQAMQARTLATDRTALQERLDAAGVANADVLEAQRGKARSLEGERAGLEGRLAALAPHGLAVLLEQRQEAETALGGLGAVPAEERSAATLAGLAQELAGHVEPTRKGLARATEMVAQLARAQAGAAARLQGHREQLTRLREQAPDAAEIERVKSNLEDEAEAASRAYDEALRIHASLKAEAPDAAGLARLENDVAAAARDIAAVGERLANLTAQRSRIEGGLEQARREDSAARLEGLLGDVEAAQQTHDDIAEEVAALRLLEAELAREEETLRTAYQVPVAERVGPYLDMVFPGGIVRLDDAFQTAGVIRDEVQERMEDLSAGTREQIAVLVRLGFARLLADRDMSWPLVLDDALVHSDDWRMSAMHRALMRASEAHQVIVLTSREQAFETLAGNRVTVAAWQPAR